MRSFLIILASIVLAAASAIVLATTPSLPGGLVREADAWRVAVAMMLLLSALWGPFIAYTLWDDERTEREAQILRAQYDAKRAERIARERAAEWHAAYVDPLNEQFGGR
jgi:hypothetical protein